MIKNLKDVENTCSSASQALCSNLAADSLCRTICPVTVIDKNKFYIDSLEHELYYFDCDKNKTIHLETYSPIETSSNCVSKAFTLAEVIGSHAPVIQSIKFLINKLIDKENEAFLSFIKSFCPEDESYSFSEEDNYYITSDFFPKDNIKKYPAKVIKTNKLQKTEVLALNSADISVFSGEPFIQAHPTPQYDSITIIAAVPNFAIVLRKNNECDIRRIHLPETFGFTTDIEKTPEIKISQEELIFRAMERETLLIDI